MSQNKIFRKFPILSKHCFVALLNSGLFKTQVEYLMQTTSRTKNVSAHEGGKHPIQAFVILHIRAV